MAKQNNQIQMPGVFGGLMRYDSEYTSKFMLSPTAIIAYIIVVIVFVIALKIFFPTSFGTPAAPVGGHGFVFPLISSVLGL